MYTLTCFQKHVFVYLLERYCVRHVVFNKSVTKGGNTLLSINQFVVRTYILIIVLERLQSTFLNIVSVW